MSKKAYGLGPFGGWAESKLISRFTTWCNDDLHKVKKNPSMWNLMFLISLEVLENYGEIASKYGLDPVQTLMIVHKATVKRTSEIMEKWAKERGLKAMYEELEKEIDMGLIETYLPS